MSGFVKLYSTILTSSVWVESTSTRIVWITLLALADKDGYVSASAPGLAHAANVSLADCEAAIRVLESPDIHSRTKTCDGRRIEQKEGGWLVLNRQKYRDLQTEKQMADAERQRRHRDMSRLSRAVATEGRVQSTEKDLTTTAGREEYPADFEMLWRLYPKRPGSSKKQTSRLVAGHLRDGVDFDVMVDGTLRYVEYVTKKGWIGTEFIKSAQVFYGRDQHFLSEWEQADLPKKLVAVGGVPSPDELRALGIRL